MKILIKELGIIHDAEISLDKNFIVFTGKNNTGKSHLNYLLYGLYRIDEDKFINQVRALIPDEISINNNNEERIIELSFNVFDFINKHLEKIFDIYKSILQENISNLFATNKLNPKIELRITDKDKHILSELKEKEVDGDDFFHYTYENLDKRSGKFSLKNGILLYKANNISPDIYENSKWRIDFSKEAKEAMILNIIFEILRFFKEIVSFPNSHPANSNVYFFSAERSAINLFYEDIIQSKAKKGDHLSQIMNFDDFVNYKQTGAASFNYPLPINDYLYYIDYLGKLNRRESKFKTLSTDIETLIGGKILLGEYNEMKFVPNKSNDNLDLHTSSSTVKSFAGLAFYFNHLAQKGDTIFIDEPELNLHPDNQRKVARLLSKAFNNGIRIFISTHSDYIIRELNNLIMLNQDSKKAKELQQKYKYSDDELCSSTDFNIYLCSENKVELLPISETGFEVDTIDTEINLLNQISQDIYFSLYD